MLEMMLKPPRALEDGSFRKMIYQFTIVIPIIYCCIEINGKRSTLSVATLKKYNPINFIVKNKKNYTQNTDSWMERLADNKDKKC